MPTAWGFGVRGDANSETLEIDIYDIVGDSWWSDTMVSAKSVRALLKANKAAKTIKLRINSEGGDVFDGFAIYNILQEHPARVEASIDALAASIASVIAMAADEITIASNAFVMIHNAWGGVRGSADDLRSWADVLDKMTANAADIYAARSGKPRQQIADLMAAESWLSASEAKALGLVDTVVPIKQQPAASAQAQARAFAWLQLDDYARVPDGVREAVKAARADEGRRIAGTANSFVRSDHRVPAIDPADEDPARSTVAAKQSTGPESPSNTRENTMNKKLIAQLLGISESAADDAFEAAMQAACKDRDTARTALARIETLTGRAGDEAHGVLLAWKQSHEELPGVRTQLSTATAAAEARDLDGEIAKAKAESRHTPAREEKVRKLLADGEIKLAGAKAMVGEWGTVKGLAAAKDGASAAAGGGTTGAGAALTHNGKRYVDMNSGERRALANENAELFVAMRDEALAKGEI